jgi:DNA-binding MarR family transcriptional regulator/N-acetylglutamate synthase-like GNAT family acetyltransferase
MTTPDDLIEAVRRFSRFYTKRIGLLNESILESPYTLPQARVIYELAHHGTATASLLAAELALDQGYLSRLLRRLEGRGLVQKRRSDTDRRKVVLSLSENGRAAFEHLDAGSRRQIDALLSELSASEQQRVVEAMDEVRRAWRDEEPGHGDAPPLLLRPHRAGDMGWIVQRHGELYALEQGWDDSFEAWCAEIAAKFLRDFDTRYERSWIAARAGERVGCVLLVRRSREVGQLRLLLVEPSARGLGIGGRLVSECVSHARHVGYRRIMLFTVRGLESARKLYEAEGFRLVHEEPERVGGQDRVGETWELELDGGGGRA